MPRLKIASFGLVALLAVGGCASTPMGPRVLVMPSPNKPPEVFADDRAACRQFAEQEVAGDARHARRRQFGTAAIGTVLGAAFGAAIGGARGAGVGAASGAIFGTAAGAGGASRAQYGIQRRYDIAYSQCMYMRGNQVPGFAAPAPPPPPPPE